MKKRRLQFASHCVRSSGQLCQIWRSMHGIRGVGRPIMTYVDLLCQDTGLTPAEIKACMEKRRVWRAIIDVRQMSTEWLRVSVILSKLPDHLPQFILRFCYNHFNDILVIKKKIITIKTSKMFRILDEILTYASWRK